MSDWADDLPEADPFEGLDAPADGGHEDLDPVETSPDGSLISPGWPDTDDLDASSDWHEPWVDLEPAFGVEHDGLTNDDALISIDAEPVHEHTYVSDHEHGYDHIDVPESTHEPIHGVAESEVESRPPWLDDDPAATDLPSDLDDHHRGPEARIGPLLDERAAVGRRWADLIGIGASDPWGEVWHPHAAESPFETPLLEVPADDELDLDHAGWVDIDALEGLEHDSSRPADDAGPSDEAQAAVGALWDRLMGDEPAPTTADGAFDVTGALDHLSAQPSAPMLTEVIEAARARLAG